MADAVLPVVADVLGIGRHVLYPNVYDKTYKKPPSGMLTFVEINASVSFYANGWSCPTKPKSPIENQLNRVYRMLTIPHLHIAAKLILGATPARMGESQALKLAHERKAWSKIWD